MFSDCNIAFEFIAFQFKFLDNVISDAPEKICTVFNYRKNGI